MMTIAQWVSLRRVDHLSLPALSINRGFHIAHPRFRKWGAGNHPNLKVFDQYLIAFTAANNDQDRAGILADILVQADQFLAGGHDQRYTAPIHQLRNTAIADLTQICGAGQAQRTQDIRDIAAGNQIAGRTVTVNVFCLIPVGGQQPNVDGTIDAHITNANNSQAYQDADITVVRANNNCQYVSSHKGQSILLTHPPAPQNMAGKLQDSAQGGARLIGACNANALGGQVDIVYVPGFDQDDVLGRTFRAGQNYYGAVPARPIVTVTLNPPNNPQPATYPTTLAHELGHALTGDPGHSLDANNLMASGAIRAGVDDLNGGQIAWFRRNPYTH
jgi:hypothetical protein